MPRPRRMIAAGVAAVIIVTAVAGGLIMTNSNSPRFHIANALINTLEDGSRMLTLETITENPNQFTTIIHDAVIDITVNGVLVGSIKQHNITMEGGEQYTNIEEFKIGLDSWTSIFRNAEKGILPIGDDDGGFQPTAVMVIAATGEGTASGQFGQITYNPSDTYRVEV